MLDDIYHGSPDPLSEIHSDGVFGGIFAGSRAAAASHGSHVYEIVSPKHLDDHTLNYEIDGAFDIAVEITGDEDTAEAIMQADTPISDDVAPEDAADVSWELQRLRGELARRLGYTSVTIEDEHGTVYLCLPGSEIRTVS